jgi:membrane associated rhomboid family serine protease/cytochrome c-type biogenesis protein CcmH/NrfG
MATCARCGRELPTFSFGEVSNLCPSCKQMVASSPQIPSSVQPPGVGPPPGTPVVTRVPYRPPVTTAILAINVLVFAAMVARGVPILEPNSGQLLNWGADFGPYSLGTQPWRILTSNYLHIGLIHIAVNMWALWQLGRLAERIFGGWAYFLTYTAAGIAGSLLSLLHNPNVPSAGASGAIFGLIGALIAALYLGKLPFPPAARQSLLKNLLWTAGINLYLGAKIPGIDNSGHIGGFVMGLALGAIVGPQLMEPIDKRRRHEALTFFATALLLMGFGMYVRQKNGYVTAIDAAGKALGAGHTDQAITELQRYLAHDPNDLFALNMLARAYMSKNDYPRTESTLQKVVQLEPDNITAKYILGLTYAAEHRYEDARQVFEQLVRQNPQKDDAWVMLGASLDGLNREREAIDAYRKAIALNPQNSEAYRELGLAQMKLNRPEDAISALQKAAQLDPNNPEIQKDLSDVYSVMGKTAEATAATRKAEELSKTAPKKPAMPQEP